LPASRIDDDEYLRLYLSANGGQNAGIPADKDRGRQHVALFQRKRRRDVKRLEEMAREWWPKVPQTFPDGTHFPARQPYDDVLAIAAKIIRNGGPEWVVIFCTKVLAHYATLADVPFYRVSFLGMEAPEARKDLLAAGMAAEERALSNALLLAFDFHEKAGHRSVVDVDAQGNVLDVDEVGNIRDAAGNILPTDELGRVIPPES
jgi:hypothetical protein